MKKIFIVVIIFTLLGCSSTGSIDPENLETITDAALPLRGTIIGGQPGELLYSIEIELPLLGKISMGIKAKRIIFKNGDTE